MANCAFCVTLRSWWIQLTLEGHDVRINFKDATPDVTGEWQGRSGKWVTVDGNAYNLKTVQNITRTGP